MTALSLRFWRSARLPVVEHGGRGEPDGVRESPGAAAADAGHAEFHERLEGLSRVVCALDFGVPELASTAQMRRAQWAEDSAHRHEAALVYVSGSGAHDRLAAAWTLSIPLLDNLDAADLEVLIPPAEDSDELFAAVLVDAQARARELGRRLVNVFGAQREVAAGGIEPALAEAGDAAAADATPPRFALADERDGIDVIGMRAGTGAVPVNSRMVRRMREAGFEPVQLTRFSLLDTAEIGTQMPAAPPGFAFAQWAGKTPEAWEARMAELYTVFETTVPVGGATYEPEAWDVARLRVAEAVARESGVTRLVTALSEADTGRPVGFTLFEHTDGAPLAFQEHTVVRPEHRGKGLAVWLKRANAAQLRRLRPEVRLVCTWNAVENLSMLAVNRVVGFRPQAFTVVWEADGRRDACRAAQAPAHV